MNKVYIPTEYIRTCGCTSIWKTPCRLHHEEILVASQFKSDHKVRNIRAKRSVYCSSIYTYIESSVKKRYRKVLIERPNHFVLFWLSQKIQEGSIKELIILDSSQRDISLDTFEYQRRIPLNGFTLYTHGTDASFKTLDSVLEWDYSSYLNCSIGKAYDSIHGIVHTPYLSTYQYLTDSAYRKAIKGP